MFNRFSRRAAVAVLALALAAPAFAQSISGIYRAEGRNPDGSAYRGTATISETGKGVTVNWVVGSQSYSGQGTRNGDIIAVDWGDQYPVIYVRMPSGELHGTWSNGTALERLIPSN